MRLPLSPLLAATIACRSVSARQLPPAAFMGCCIPRHLESTSRNRMGSTTPNGNLLDPSGAALAPSRSSSSIPERKRRRLIAELSFSTAIFAETQRGGDQQQPPRRKKNRPGFNSYLKVLLDGSTMQLLRQTTLDVQRMLHESDKHDTDEAGNVADEQQITRSNSSLNSERTAVAPIVIAENNKLPSLRINPRSLNSLHMTFFFGGEILCELSREELTDWHGQVKKRIQQSFPSSSNNEKDDNPAVGTDSSLIDDNGNADGEDYWFRLNGLCLFPPQRKNLIVASLEASPSWHALHNDIRAIAAQSPSEQLRSVVQSTSFQEWKPHITLANLRSSGPRRSQKLQQERLQELLDQVDLSTVPTLKANGIAMGGPIPEQAPLDWTFPTT